MKLIRHCDNLLLAIATLAAVTLFGSMANASRQYRTLYTFKGGSDGKCAIGVPAVDEDGNLYGVTSICVFLHLPPCVLGAATSYTVPPGDLARCVTHHPTTHLPLAGS